MGVARGGEDVPQDRISGIVVSLIRINRDNPFFVELP